jgi:hypothetical protein
MQFTIRDAVWLGALLLVGCGLSAGWLIESVRHSLENSRLRSRLSQTEGHLQELQRILKENGLQDPGYYYW